MKYLKIFNGHFDMTCSRETLFLEHHVSSSRPSNPPAKSISVVE